MGVIAFYTLELLPPVGAWARAQAWRGTVPMVFVLATALGLLGAVWHIAVRPRWSRPRRIVVALLVLPTTLFGLLGYYWFGIAADGGTRASPAAPAV